MDYRGYIIATDVANVHIGHSVTHVDSDGDNIYFHVKHAGLPNAIGSHAISAMERAGWTFESECSSWVHEL